MVGVFCVTKSVNTPLMTIAREARGSYKLESSTVAILVESSSTVAENRIVDSLYSIICPFMFER